ncbi:hypothetical protein ACKGJI_03195 [Sulfurospirillum sp. 1307]|jgi:hypothetical protein
MKDSKTIISHLKKHPSLKTLQKSECYEALLELLPNSLSNFIKFIYTKHDTLFFVLTHPSAKMEFNYKRNLIKTLLNTLETFQPKCKCINLKEIKAFVTNKQVEEKIDKNSSFIYYKERSSGKFENIAKNEKLYDLFEKIRKEIKKSNASKDT